MLIFFYMCLRDPDPICQFLDGTSWHSLSLRKIAVTLLEKQNSPDLKKNMFIHMVINFLVLP